jgi:proteasome lid subunit RPN8/RPN11
MSKRAVVVLLLILIFLEIVGLHCAHGQAAAQDKSIKTPEVEQTIRVLNALALSHARDQVEFSSVVNGTGQPGPITSSHDNLRNAVTVTTGEDLAIIHSHPAGAEPKPSSGDVAIAKHLQMPNYVVSVYALWVAEPSGAIRKVADLKYKKHNVLTIAYK